MHDVVTKWIGHDSSVDLCYKDCTITSKSTIGDVVQALCYTELDEVCIQIEEYVCDDGIVTLPVDTMDNAHCEINVLIDNECREMIDEIHLQSCHKPL